MSEARLIALDWGSTRLRAFLLGASGEVLATRQSDDGAATLKGADVYAAALNALVGDWRAEQPQLKLLACGMVGSQYGWKEAPYVRCPGDAAALAAQALAIDASLSFIPGLVDDAAQPDVMRGEETQIVGALALQPALAEDAVLVLPGTHSKWARVRGGKVTGFATHMTGELFALLRQHSVLNRLMPADGSSPASPEAFLKGVDAAQEAGGLGHQLFAVRTLGLFKQLAADQLPDYLSGLLIGHEITSELQDASRRVALIGDPALCARYAQALQHLGQPAPLLLDNTAPAGLWALAQTMKLI
ncbi:2-dehydro-3-deoxygalactonokinase [Roseateles asaccharophilus]|uniref:2-dehydro-3-deoxygalactonokinase n=1 Tax=Roseateles asaccharophilus TaxID=582607 RepID=A0ABU2A6S6_9BURK|nr:2-dehydro-3-deoxygalactonokinase [Roseateles asaccharophilus]MDR7332902.1 2-dehydro-3-deoxygalactonokinase [Roseateles asaccharophilus]